MIRDLGFGEGIIVRRDFGAGLFTTAFAVRERASACCAATTPVNAIAVMPADVAQDREMDVGTCERCREWWGVAVSGRGEAREVPYLELFWRLKN